MGKWIRANGIIEVVVPADGRSFTLGELQFRVGGYFEIMKLNGNNLLIVNEDGRIRRLPFNRKATTLFGIHLVGDVMQIEKKEIE